MALTEQMRRYAEARLSGKPKKAAAIAAGCPEKTASQAASRYEKSPDVMAFLGRKAEADKIRAERGIKEDKPNVDPSPYIPGQYEDPIDFMKAMTNDLEAEPKLRLEAAKAWASFTKGKPGEAGKKDQQKAAAEKAAKGKFRSAAPPSLKAVK